MQEINATTFKAKCLAILDEVAATGEGVLILKRGKPVAQLMPPVVRAEAYPQYELFGTVRIRGDDFAPALPPEAWNAERGELD